MTAQKRSRPDARTSKPADHSNEQAKTYGQAAGKASDQRADGFAAFRGRWIEKALRDHELPDGAFRVLVCLAHDFLSREKRSCWPAQETIAAAVGMPIRTVQRHLSTLQARGHLHIVRQGRERPNAYRPAFRDAPNLADHDEAMTRQNLHDDPPNHASKTRHEWRTNPLSEPFEELRQAPAAPANGGHSLQISGTDAHESASGRSKVAFSVGGTIDLPGHGTCGVGKIGCNRETGQIYLYATPPDAFMEALVVPVDESGTAQTDRAWWEDANQEQADQIDWNLSSIAVPTPRRKDRRHASATA